MLISDQQLKNIIEAAIMAAGEPLTIDKLLTLFVEQKEPPTRDAVKAAIKQIEEECESRGVELKKVSSGYRFQAKKEFAPWISMMWEEKPARYSRALLETLVLIAYKQPITRGEIEHVRGVAVSSNIVKTLLERDWVKVVGHRDVPGRPALYATTKSFLDYFNLNSLDEMPTLAEIRDLDKITAELDLQPPGVDDYEAADSRDEASGEISDETSDEISDEEIDSNIEDRDDVMLSEHDTAQPADDMESNDNNLESRQVDSDSITDATELTESLSNNEEHDDAMLSEHDTAQPADDMSSNDNNLESWQVDSDDTADATELTESLSNKEDHDDVMLSEHHTAQPVDDMESNDSHIESQQVDSDNIVDTTELTETVDTANAVDSDEDLDSKFGS